MAKLWSVITSLLFLAVLSAMLLPWPKLPSLPEPSRIIELPCNPPPSLLIWWDRETAWAETGSVWSMKGKNTNVEYWHDGEFVASHSQIRKIDFDSSQPYVSWRAVIGSEVHIELGGPESEAFEDEISRCELLPVVFTRFGESPHPQVSQSGSVD